MSTVPTYSNSNIHPLKLALWISFGSISMMFAGLLSAYIVRQAAGNWLEFPPPTWFGLSTVLVVLTSISIFLSLRFFKAEQEIPYKGFLILTALLGGAFVVSQYLGWMQMQSIGIDLKGNPSGAFVIVISGLHVAHIVGGLAILVVALVHAFALPFRVTPKRILRLELSAHYWHYVDIVWIVLYLFFTYYR